MTCVEKKSCSLLRTLGVLLPACLLLSGCGGYYGTSEYEQAMAKQKGFSDLIADAGGKASKEGRRMHGFEMTGWLIDLTSAKVSDDLIASITEAAAKDAIFQLVLSKSSITDEQLKKLDEGKVFQKMVALDLSDTAVTDAGLDSLTTFYCITELKLKGSKATQAGAKRLGDRQIANPDTPPPFKRQPKVEI